MNLTKEHRIARHKDFLKANWELLSAFSWEHLQAQGPGAVLVPEADLVHAAMPQLAGLRFHCLPLAGHDKPPFADVFAEKELGWLGAYDPDARAIVVILREGGEVSSYFIGGPVKPSEAFVRQQAKGN